MLLRILSWDADTSQDIFRSLSNIVFSFPVLQSLYSSEESDDVSAHVSSLLDSVHARLEREAAVLGLELDSGSSESFRLCCDLHTSHMEIVERAKLALVRSS